MVVSGGLLILILSVSFVLILRKYPERKFGRVISIDEQSVELQLKGTKKMMTIAWKDVAALYPRNKGYGKTLALDLKDGLACGILLKKKSDDIVDEVYRHYEASVMERVARAERLETRHCKGVVDDVLRAKHFLYLTNAGLLSANVIMVIHAVVTMQVPVLMAVWPGFLIILVLLVYDGISWVQYRRYMNRIIASLLLVDNRVVWQTLSGNRRDMQVCDVNEYRLDKLKGSITFTDGSKLHELQKLDYWPVVREHLLLKLKQYE